MEHAVETNEQTELLREMRDLLRLLAEPALAQRDQRLRTSLLEIVGKAKSKAKAVFLMDGSRGQAAVCKESGVDDGNLSRLVKALRTAGLVGPEGKPLKLAIAIQNDFFEQSGKKNG